jgi:hypothetical protein
MRAERDHHVEVSRLAADLVEQSGEEQSEWTRARSVGHDEQHLLCAVVLSRASLGNQGPSAVRRQKTAPRSEIR